MTAHQTRVREAEVRSLFNLPVVYWAVTCTCDPLFHAAAGTFDEAQRIAAKHEAGA